MAGLTMPSSLFCLETFARDLRMHVVFRAEHRYRADGSVEHRITGPAHALDAASRVVKSGPGWAGRMAEFLARFPAERGEESSLTVVTPASEGAPREGVLTSWIIVPIVA